MSRVTLGAARIAGLWYSSIFAPPRPLRDSNANTHALLLKYCTLKVRYYRTSESDVEQVYHTAAVVSHRLLRRLALGRRRRELLAQRELVLVRLRVRVRVRVRLRGRGRGR